MKVTSLCYRDASGGCRLDPITLQRHLEAIEQEVLLRRNARRPATVHDILRSPSGRHGCLLTFDHAASGAITTIAPLLEDCGWRGHFFINPETIGKPGFLARDQLCWLRRRGHVIGCASGTHRGRVPVERLLQEWSARKAALADLLQEEVTVAALASGLYSRRLAEAAAIVGWKALFTAQPRPRVESCGDCLVFGRYLLHPGASPKLAAKLATGSACFCMAQRLFWNVTRLTRWGWGGFY